MDVFLYASRVADAVYPGMHGLVAWVALWALIVSVMLMIYKFLS